MAENCHLDNPAAAERGTGHDLLQISYSTVPNIAAIAGDLEWDEKGPCGDSQKVYNQSAILEVEIDPRNGRARKASQDGCPLDAVIST